MSERDKYCKLNTTTLIIGTKSDLHNKILINDEMISDLCIKYNVSYMETSSKYDININEAFQLICKKLIEKNDHCKTINFNVNLGKLQNNKC